MAETRIKASFQARLPADTDFRTEIRGLERLAPYFFMGRRMETRMVFPQSQEGPTVRFAPMLRLGREQVETDGAGLKAKNAELLQELRRERHKRREAEAEVKRLQELLNAATSALLEKMR